MWVRHIYWFWVLKYQNLPTKVVPSPFQFVMLLGNIQLFRYFYYYERPILRFFPSTEIFGKAVNRKLLWINFYFLDKYLVTYEGNFWYMNDQVWWKWLCPPSSTLWWVQHIYWFWVLKYQNLPTKVVLFKNLRKILNSLSLIFQDCIQTLLINCGFGHLS